MKKVLFFTFLALFLLSITVITGVYAMDDGSKKVTLIKNLEDISGDGKKEEILIQGMSLQNDERIFHEVLLTVKLSNGKSFKERLDYGLYPEISLIDLDHDGVKDVFITIPTDESGGEDHQYLYSVKDFSIRKLEIPTLEIEGQFTNGYKAKIFLPATNKSYVFDLMIRKEKYAALGMYLNGKLNEPTELMILPDGKLTPVIIEDSKYGLMETRKITGISKSDSIALIKSVWIYTGANWKLVKTEVNSAKN